MKKKIIVSFLDVTKMFAFVPLNQFTIVNIPSPTRSENVKNGAKLWEQPIVPVKGTNISKQQIEPEKNGIISQHQLPSLLIDSKAGGSNAVNEDKYENNYSDNEEDIHICGKCRQEFTRYDLFILHKKSCSSRYPFHKKKYRQLSILLIEAFPHLVCVRHLFVTGLFFNLSFKMQLHDEF